MLPTFVNLSRLFIPQLQQRLFMPLLGQCLFMPLLGQRLFMPQLRQAYLRLCFGSCFFCCLLSLEGLDLLRCQLWSCRLCSGCLSFLSCSDLLCLLFARQLLEAVDSSGRAYSSAKSAGLALCRIDLSEVVLNVDSVKVADCCALHASDTSVIAVLACNCALVCG